MIANEENVARAIFSPKMIRNGKLSPEAFILNHNNGEDYLSVMLTTLGSWMSDILNIPTRKNRILFGYAQMNVGEIREAGFNNIVYDVLPHPSSNMQSHCGIHISSNGKQLIGGQAINDIPEGETDDSYRLRISNRLRAIAQKGLVELG